MVPIYGTSPAGVRPNAKDTTAALYSSLDRNITLINWYTVYGAISKLCRSQRFHDQTAKKISQPSDDRTASYCWKKDYKPVILTTSPFHYIYWLGD